MPKLYTQQASASRELESGFRGSLISPKLNELTYFRFLTENSNAQMKYHPLNRTTLFNKVEAAVPEKTSAMTANFLHLRIPLKLVVD